MPSGTSQLSPDVERFLREHVDSVEQCEMIVAMHNKSDQWWTAHELAAELYLSDVPTARDLETLARRGFLEVLVKNELHYRMAPVSQALTLGVRDLAGLYRTRRVDILSYVVRKKGRPLKHFADAFRFRKGD
jgi:hypothetical protein